MNPLKIPAPNSILLMDERLQKLKEEVALIEKEIEPITKILPPQGTKIFPIQKPQMETRYQGLPTIEPEPPKKIQLRPQINEEYKRTLQYCPNIMSGYDINVQEAQFLSEVQSLPIPPKLTIESTLLFSFLESQAKKIV
ncbi:unnamed protein product [Blepharisma stoltei]|uniref:Uncharacterized protein n=1 Tax=Blepharisma stoltei TaxID=1481888 RepID=A0AAU9ISH1_9CILI|nr:unnamed protein product [Blepharisma stoltei]